MEGRDGTVIIAKDLFIGEGMIESKRKSKSGLKDGSLRAIQYVKSVSIAVTVQPNCIGSSTTGFLALRQKIRDL